MLELRVKGRSRENMKAVRRGPVIKDLKNSLKEFLIVAQTSTQCKVELVNILKHVVI